VIIMQLQKFMFMETAVSKRTKWQMNKMAAVLEMATANHTQYLVSSLDLILLLSFSLVFSVVIRAVIKFIATVH